MTETIVCGVDKSGAANAVVDAARWLAQGLGARLIIAHVVEEPAQEAQELVASVRQRLSEDDTDVRLVEGSPTERLIDTAENEGAALLVVGSRGRRALRAGVLGSVSRALATTARCPVMLVPQAAGEAGAGNEAWEGVDASVVCGVDGSEHALTAAEVAGWLARGLGYRLIIVHSLPNIKAAATYLGARATTPALSAQEDTRRADAAHIVEMAAGSVDIEAATAVESGPPWEALEGVADREAGRLLVVAARGIGAVRAALLGSVTVRLAASATRSVVVIPEPAETVIPERHRV